MYSLSANLGKTCFKFLSTSVSFVRSRSSTSPRLLHKKTLVAGGCSGVSLLCSAAATFNMATKRASPTATVMTRFDQICKGGEDKRQYRGLVLENGLRVLLVSDSAADKSAASLDVNVGAMKDPWQLPGLAHFCEHMLFLGTDKYPSENEYFKYLQTHGGASNAYTGADHTNYHFDVAPEHLEGALDRFAQFFLAPQFTESATEREVNAVDSENSNYLNKDEWRMMQLQKSMSNPSHDFFKFSTGNKQTLMDDAKAAGIDTREELLKFHRKHYSSNIMALCVVGKESLDELEEKYVLPTFTSVENKSLERYSWNEHPFGPEQLGYKLQVVPIKDTRSLSLIFPIPDLTPHYRSQPGHFISHLLGHEGEGSLLSELKRRGWVSSLSAGSHTVVRGFGYFSIDVDLSEEGLEHTDEIIQLVFEFLALIRKDGIKQWVHDELRQLNDIKFRFKDKENPSGYATSLAASIHDYPLDDILYAPYKMDEYREDLIHMVMDHLSPDKMLTFVCSQKFKDKEGNVKEKWYGTEYSKERIDKGLLDKCQKAMQEIKTPNLKLPLKNEFIPSNFELVPRDDTKDCTKDAHCKYSLPRMIQDDQFTRVWYLQDEEFLLPKSVAKMHLCTPVVNQNPKAAFHASMLISCLNDQLTEYTYNAYLAGLNYGLNCGKHGINIGVSGYNEKQPVLLERIVEKVADFEPDPKRFAVLKEYFVRQLHNFKHDQPYNHAFYYSGLLLGETGWTNEQLLAVEQTCTVDSLKKFAAEVLEAVHVESFVHGNVTRQAAIDMTNTVVSVLKSRKPIHPLFPQQMSRDRAIEIPAGTSTYYEATNKTHDNSCVEMLLQTGQQAERENVILELLGQAVTEDAFNTLRTKEQLGYIVWTGPRRSNGVQEFRVVVQGSKDPAFMEERIEAFLKQTRDLLEAMPESEFSDHKSALITRRLERPKRLSRLAGNYWSEIVSRQYHFDRDYVEVEALRQIAKSELIDYFDQMISENAPSRRKLVISVISSQVEQQRAASGDDKEKTAMRIDDMNEWKQRRPLYPHAEPYLKIPLPGTVNEQEAKAKL